MIKKYVIVLTIILGGCGASDTSPDENSEIANLQLQIEQLQEQLSQVNERDLNIEEIPSIKEESSNIEEIPTIDVEVKWYQDLLEIGRDTGPMHIFGNIEVGVDVEPGIYDLVVLAGGGNLMGERANGFRSDLPRINWIVNSGQTLRIMLEYGDVLDFRSIDQAEFRAINAVEQMSNSLGMGDFIVGLDIAPGIYQLETDYFNSRWETSGFDVTIGQPGARSSDQQSARFNPSNPEVMVRLLEGDILSIDPSSSLLRDSPDAMLRFIEQ